MDIIIAMTIAFLLGAYIRKPFAFVRHKVEVEVPKQVEPPKAQKKTPEQIYDEAYYNATRYDGSEQPDIKENE